MVNKGDYTQTHADIGMEVSYHSPGMLEGTRAGKGK